MKYLVIVYFITIIFLGWFSYGFLDPNLSLSSNPIFAYFQSPLSYLVYHNRSVATAVFFLIVLSLFFSYACFLRFGEKFFIRWKRLLLVVIASAMILVFSYPALTYDLFNYITTAKVTFTHRENPYLVMPIEIPNEPNLAFTRAANKVALYGPVWILLTAVGHYLGGGDVWRTIIAFKLMNAAVYLGFCFMIWRLTKKLTNVIFFAFNPLIVIEILVSGHNDIYMMFFAVIGFICWQKRGLITKTVGLLSIFASLLVKGATLVLIPLLFIKKLSWDRLLLIAYCLLSIAFFAVAPLREELYPWYAVWLIVVASFMDFKKQTFITGFSVVLSFALELRHLPYLWMGYYEGPGPILRTLFTFIPIVFYGGMYIYENRFKES